MCIFGPNSTIFHAHFAFLGCSFVQVTATKLAWTHAQTPVSFLLFSGEICTVLNMEF
jgi:hypothetical protein